MVEMVANSWLGATAPRARSAPAPPAAAGARGRQQQGVSQAARERGVAGPSLDRRRLTRHGQSCRADLCERRLLLARARRLGCLLGCGRGGGLGRGGCRHGDGRGRPRLLARVRDHGHAHDVVREVEDEAAPWKEGKEGKEGGRGEPRGGCAPAAARLTGRPCSPCSAAGSPRCSRTESRPAGGVSGGGDRIPLCAMRGGAVARACVGRRLTRSV